MAARGDGGDQQDEDDYTRQSPRPPAKHVTNPRLIVQVDWPKG